MDKQQALALLNAVQSGAMTPDQALLRFREQPFEELGYATVDHHRGLRQGFCEVIYGAGKTILQIEGISRSMLDKGNTNILITRLAPEAADALGGSLPLWYDATSRIGIVERREGAKIGNVAVVSGGTSDMPVAEEAAITAETLGANVHRVYDVGVAGLHRLLSKMDILMQAKAVIAVAGMEGALASVVGGLCDCPVIAVPTSVGYGASFGGVAALLSMLNSCASGVSVVNIDNGFGAGYLAAMINRMGELLPKEGQGDDPTKA